MNLHNNPAHGSAAIQAVAAAAMTHPQPVRMWFGESDLGTPPCIHAAAERALQAGHTFYAPRHGVPALRQAIARYQSTLLGRTIGVERVTVTASGMNAIMLVLQLVAGRRPGNIVVVTPVWPNVIGAIQAIGSEPRAVRLDEGPHGWSLDLARLQQACDEHTRAVFVASPGNPTGWVCPPEQQAALIAFCRTRQIALIADEVYQRLMFDTENAPSFLTAPLAEDAPLYVVNSFSKAWAMSGWRLGWLVHPEVDSARIGELNAVNNTGAATFIQHAGVAALEQGESFVRELRQYCRRGRDLAFRHLAGQPRVHVINPPSGMYLFFQVVGVTDSLRFATSLARQTGIGLAPGCAFGADNADYLRLCYALKEPTLRTALERINEFIAAWDDKVRP